MDATESELNESQRAIRFRRGRLHDERMAGARRSLYNRWFDNVHHAMTANPSASIRDTLRIEYCRLPLRDLWIEITPSNLGCEFGDPVPCDGTDCWYRDNLDKLGEMYTVHLSVASQRGYKLCDDCIGNSNYHLDWDVDDYVSSYGKWLVEQKK